MGDQYNLEKCPFCNNINYKGNKHHFKFYINKNNHLYHCFNCSVDGNLFKFVKHISGSIPEELLRDSYSFDCFKNLLQEAATDESAPEKPVILPLSLECMSLYCTGSMEPYEYLGERGIDVEMFLAFNNIYYSPYQKRIIFPVLYQKKMVGYISRDITGTQDRKYLINKGFKKNRYLYNYDVVYQNENVVLVEGVFDVIKNLGTMGVASFGKTLSREQLYLLLRMPNLKRVYVGYDDDAPEEKRRFAKILLDFFEVYTIKYPTVEDDPGSLSNGEMLQCLAEATLYSIDGEFSNLLK